jgi:hypothetical protein
MICATLVSELGTITALYFRRALARGADAYPVGLLSKGTAAAPNNLAS